METIEAICQLFANLGVPVACMVGAFWLLNKERIDHKNEVDALREATAANDKEIAQALNNNTLAIQKLIDKLEGIGK